MLTIAVYKTPSGIKVWIEDVAVMNHTGAKGSGKN